LKWWWEPRQIFIILSALLVNNVIIGKICNVKGIKNLIYRQLWRNYSIWSLELIFLSHNSDLIWMMKIPFRFCVGDRFFFCDNKILCEYDYEERMVFANLVSHKGWIRCPESIFKLYS
jgi:hypothetical protein